MSQDMKDDTGLRVNPIIEKLSEVAGRDSVVELQGYVGPSEPDVIRLYEDFSMTHYVEIPKDSMLHAVETKDDETGQVKLYVAASTQVLAASVKYSRVSADEYRRVPAGDFPRAVPLRPGPLRLGAAECRKIRDIIGTLGEILDWLNKNDPEGDRYGSLYGKIYRQSREMQELHNLYCW